MTYWSRNSLICRGVGIVLNSGRAGAGLALLLLDDVVAQVDAVGADVDVVGPFDHRAGIALALAAEAARGACAAPAVPVRPDLLLARVSLP